MAVVLHFPVLRFPAVTFGHAHPSPVFSSPYIWSHKFRSCIFLSWHLVHRFFGLAINCIFIVLSHFPRSLCKCMCTSIVPLFTKQLNTPVNCPEMDEPVMSRFGGGRLVYVQGTMYILDRGHHLVNTIERSVRVGICHRCTTYLKAMPQANLEAK